MTLTTGMLMSGKMSAGMRTIATTPSNKMAKAMTTNV